MSKQQKSKNQKIVSRSQSRSLAFQVLYSIEFSYIQSEEALRQAFSTAPRVKVIYDEDELDYQIDQIETDEASKHYAPTIDSLPHQENDTVEDVNTSIIPQGFAYELVEGVWKNLDVLDETIKEYTKNWRIDRLGRIEITILRIALFEMLYRDDIPVKVSIAEALELTNQFAEIKARNFINGLLDAVHKNKISK